MVRGANRHQGRDRVGDGCHDDTSWNADDLGSKYTPACGYVNRTQLAVVFSFAAPTAAPDRSWPKAKGRLRQDEPKLPDCPRRQRQRGHWPIEDHTKSE